MLPILETFCNSRWFPRLVVKLVIALTAFGLLTTAQATSFGYAHPRSSFNAPPSTPHTALDGSVVFSHDGQLLAVADVDDQKIRVWDVSSGREKFALDGGLLIAALAFSLDGRWLASGSLLKTMTLWDLTSGQQTRTWDVAASVRSLAFGNDNRTLAIGMDREISLWRVDSQRELHTLKGHQDRVNCLAFSADGRTLASGSKDLSVRLWDVNGGAQLRTLEGSSLQVLAVVFNPDGHTLASADWTGNVKIWEIPSGAVQRTLPGNPLGYVATTLAFSRDGQTLASASVGAVILWDTAHSFRPLRLDDSLNNQAVAFNADGTLLFAGGANGILKVWNPATGEEVPLKSPESQ
jgi:WD40 repeat protein